MASWAFALSILAVIIGYGVVWYLKLSRRRAVIASIRNGQDVIATCYYNSGDWRFAAEQYFKIRTRPGDFGKVSFTPRHIYVSNGKKDFLYELVGAERYVKHLTEVYLYKKSPMNVIKFEVRTKVVGKDKSGNERLDEKCTLEEFYVPVPSDYETGIGSLMKFYQDILDDNADAVAAVTPYGLGIFGK